ncbi:MAG TPA: division/cell wall cluster transcriptional repressor MraZ [Candidatus Acidoferrales bacterium]|nr:division/cell wall cluster transcriptional repressor MraZ [Candidatus Acidoferrales bacterium]
MFRGTFEHTVDEKGRVSIPSRFRELLQATGDDRVVITNFQMGDAPCLDAYPYADWEKLEADLIKKPQFKRNLLTFVTFYTSHAQVCEIDKQGRILLPPTLREYAGLKKDVVVASALQKFRIFDRDVWKQAFQSASLELTQNPQLLDELEI